MLFGEDCRDSDGRLHFIRQGKNGIGLVCAYLNTLDWTADVPLDLVEIKLQRLSTELIHLRGPDADELFVLTRPLSMQSRCRNSPILITDNTAQSELSFQRKAVQKFCTRQPLQVQAPPPPNGPSTSQSSAL